MSNEMQPEEIIKAIEEYLLSNDEQLGVTGSGFWNEVNPTFKDLQSVAEYLLSPSKYVCEKHGLNHEIIGHLYSRGSGFFAPKCTYSSGGYSCQNDSQHQFGIPPDEVDKDKVNNGDTSQFYCSLHCENARTHFKPKRGYVYLICDLVSGQYKIGKSLDVDKRVKQLGVNSTGRRELIGSFEAQDYSLAELLLHSYFDSKRCKGEWFFLDDDDVDLFLDSNFLKHIGTGVIL